MKLKLPYEVKPSIIPSSNNIVADIVHFIDHRDIENYIYRKFLGEQATQDVRQQMNAELRRLENELKGTGYEITYVHKLEIDIADKLRKEYDLKLKKDTSKYRHEISVLQKKLNKIQEIVNVEN